MTAVDRPERPDPTDTDREAVARALQHAAYPNTPWGDEAQGVQAVWMGRADRLTTDPAARTALIRSVIAGGAGDVLDAVPTEDMLAALVRRNGLAQHDRDFADSVSRNVLWNTANLIGFTIGQGDLDGTDAARVAAAIRAAGDPEEFAAACREPVTPRQDGEAT